MYLDAIFVISNAGFKTIEKMDSSRRLDYILDVEENKTFIKHIIDIEDYFYTPNFYNLLMSLNLSLFELEEQSMKNLYEDDYFKVYSVNNEKTKLLFHKLHNISLEEIKEMELVKNPHFQDLVQTQNKFKNFMNLLKEAYEKDASLLIIMRKK